MSYLRYGFPDTEVLVRWIFVVVIVWLSCCCVCYGVSTAWAKAESAVHRRRAEAGLRAEVARGLAEIEQVLRARSGSAATRIPPEADADNTGPPPDGQ